MLDVDKKREDGTFNVEDELKLRDFVSHYAIEDLISILREIEQLHKVMMLLISYSYGIINKFESVELYERLLSEALVQKFLPWKEDSQEKGQ